MAQQTGKEEKSSSEEVIGSAVFKGNNTFFNETEYNDINKHLEIIYKNPWIRKAKQRSYSVIDLKKSDLHILEVGCGTGLDCIALAHLLNDYGSKNSKIIGIDQNNDRINECNNNLEKDKQLIQELKDNNNQISFIKSDIVNNLSNELKDEMFDMIRADRTMIHIKELDVAFENICKLCKPGGTICIIESDPRAYQRYTNDKQSLTIFDKFNKFTSSTMVENPFVAIDLLNKMSSKLKWKTQLYPQPVVIRDNKQYDPDLKRMTAIFSLCVKNNGLTQQEMDHYLKIVKQEEANNCYLQITSWFIVCGIKPN